VVNVRLPGTPFSLVLLDGQMPEMDGFSEAEQVKGDPELAGTTSWRASSPSWVCRPAAWSSGTHLPIIAMTAHAMKGDEERCLAAGMDGYVSKPIQVEQLVATIDSVLS
jgi:two-component system sensor histidine kinase/response regulator